MLLIPDPNTAVIDPFRQHPTLNINCFVQDPVTGESYTRDPRYIAKKAEDYLKGTGIADTDVLRARGRVLHLRLRCASTRTSTRATTSSTRRGRVELRARRTSSTARRTSGTSRATRRATSPSRRWTSTRTSARRWSKMLEQVGIEIEVQHHEVGTAGQAEIDMRFDTLLTMADKLMLYKYVDQERRVAARQVGDVHAQADLPGQRLGHARATSRCGRAASRCSSTRRATRGLSDLARWYIGGLLTHAPSILAFSNPTTNSYKRLVPGYEAPVNLVYSQRNRSAAVRIPLYSKSPKAKRLEFRCPDPSCNPYLAFAAMLDGRHRRHPEPDRAAHAGRPRPLRPPARRAREGAAGAGLARRRARARSRPTTSSCSQGGVFTPDVIETWCEYKRVNEIDAVRLRPHPYEFYMYYDI